MAYESDNTFITLDYCFVINGFQVEKNSELDPEKQLDMRCIFEITKLDVYTVIHTYRPVNLDICKNESR